MFYILHTLLKSARFVRELGEKKTYIFYHLYTFQFKKTYLLLIYSSIRLLIICNIEIQTISASFNVRMVQSVKSVWTDPDSQPGYSVIRVQSFHNFLALSSTHTSVSEWKFIITSAFKFTLLRQPEAAGCFPDNNGQGNHQLGRNWRRLVDIFILAVALTTMVRATASWAAQVYSGLVLQHRK